MTTTYQTIADRTGTTVPPHLEHQATPPIVHAGRGARQGDVYLHPTTRTIAGTTIDLAAAGGHKVVQGDADRNSHILCGQGRFTPGTVTNRVADYGLLELADGETAWIVHTAEHGAIGFEGPGLWRVAGQISHEEEIRRAAD